MQLTNQVQPNSVADYWLVALRRVAYSISEAEQHKSNRWMSFFTKGYWGAPWSPKLRLQISYNLANVAYKKHEHNF